MVWKLGRSWSTENRVIICFPLVHVLRVWRSADWTTGWTCQPILSVRFPPEEKKTNTIKAQLVSSHSVSKTCSLVLSLSSLSSPQLSSVLVLLTWSSPPLPYSSILGVNAACDNGVAGYTHIVVSGDTCTAIATQGGITYARLQSANPGINCNALYVGQVSFGIRMNLVISYWHAELQRVCVPSN